MANERITEGIVREHFKNDPLFNSIKFEEQKSTNIRVSDCLSKASKSGKTIFDAQNLLLHFRHKAWIT